MGSRRTVILIAAVLIGAIAAYALYNYVNGVEDRAYDNAKRVQVFVVKQPIAKGTPGDQAVGDKLVQAGQIPQEFRPATAITDTAVLNGKVALTNLVPGQVVVDGMFVDQATAFVTFSERIPVDQVAVTVSVDQVHGVAGLLVPGDKVNLMVVLDPQLAALAGGTPGAPTAPAAERCERRSGHGPVPLPERRGARDRTDAPPLMSVRPKRPTNPGSGLITFNVPPDAAQRIALAGSNLYMTLAPKDFQPVDVPPVDFSNLFQPGVLSPYPAGG